MKQKMIILLFTVFMMTVTLTMNSEAAAENCVVTEETAMQAEQIEVIDYGKCRETNVEWILTTDGILILVGEGTMPDYRAISSGGSNAPWDKYHEYIYGVVVAGTVNNIGAYSFYECEKLQIVYIEEGVKKIGEHAFYWCENLQEIQLPNSITSIGQGAFASCKSLKTIKLPDNLTHISDYMCSGADCLETVKLPQNLKSIGEFAFDSCRELNSIRIPEGVESIGNHAFSWCQNLQEIYIPNSVTILGNGALGACEKLKEVDLPDFITEIPDAMFASCVSLEKVKIPEKVSKIGENAFQGCDSLKNIRLPEHITELGNSVFSMIDKPLRITILNKDVILQGNICWASEFVSLRCLENSTVQNYAEQFGIPYEIIDLSLVTGYFEDVPENRWYVDSVQYVFDKGLMSGSSEYFNPTKNVTRAQLVTTIYRLAGSPEVTDYSACEVFSDVAEGKYYTDAICWAYKEGITTGNNGKFDTTGNLTRQQMAAFLFRFGTVMGYDVTDKAPFWGMLNADKVSEYAITSMEWAVGSGLISGSEMKDELGYVVYDLNPRGNTTRAQLSTILQRFCEKYEIYTQ